MLHVMFKWGILDSVYLINVHLLKDHFLFNLPSDLKCHWTGNLGKGCFIRGDKLCFILCLKM